MKVNYVPQVMDSNAVAFKAFRDRLPNDKAGWSGSAPSRRMHLGKFLLTIWLPSIEPEVEPTTFVGTRATVIKHIVPALGHVAIGSLTRDLLKEFYAFLLVNTPPGRSRPLSKTSVQRIHATLHWALQALVDADVLHKNPAAGARPKKKKCEQYEIRIWSPIELRQFLESIAGDDLYPLWRLLAFTGLRRGEALGLRWEDCRLDSRVIAIRRSLSMVEDQMYLSTPKSSQARVVEMDDRTATVLGKHQRRARHARSRDYLFCQEDGSPLIPNKVSKRFHALVEASELPTIRLHDLRHCHASHLILSGANVKSVQERLGHSDVVVTLNLYSHVLPTTQKESVKALEALYERSSSAGGS